MTSLQKAIESILKKSKKPFAAPDLMRALRTSGFTPHKTSLYRNLKKLKEQGVVDEVLLDTLSVYYEYKKKHHHHALCRICRDVTCVAHEVLEKSIAYLEASAKKKGFISQEHHVVLGGICSACQNI